MYCSLVRSATGAGDSVEVTAGLIGTGLTGRYNSELTAQAYGSDGIGRAPVRFGPGTTEFDASVRLPVFDSTAAYTVKMSLVLTTVGLPGDDARNNSLTVYARVPYPRPAGTSTTNCGFE